MAEKNMKDLFLHGLKDIYFAENEILKALSKMANTAKLDELKDAFETHREQTQEQIKRLEQVFQIIGEKPQGIPCEAIKGIIAEGEEVMKEFAEGDALDAGMIASAQAVEHYEIARYGSLRSWAELLGLDEAEDLLEQTLVEEKETDELLTEIAEGEANLEGAD